MMGSHQVSQSYDSDEGESSVDNGSNILQESEEDTADASETEEVKKESQFTEMKEQMFHDKLAGLRKQLTQLEQGMLPEFQKRLKKLEQQLKERQTFNVMWKQVEMASVEAEYIKEKKDAAEDFEVNKKNLKETLLCDLEDKKKHIEAERLSLELTGESMEVKPVTTRKLRRRINDPTPAPEKRRRVLPTELNIMLSDADIAEDMRTLSRISGRHVKRAPAAPVAPTTPLKYEAKVVDGQLVYEKKCFPKGQAILLETKEGNRIAGTICAVDSQGFQIRRMDHSRMKVWLTQLHKGMYILKRRTA